MTTGGFPRRRLAAVHEAAGRQLEKRGSGDSLARDLLDELHELCLRSGLDGLLAELARAHGLEDGSTLADDPHLRAELAARLGDRSAYDPRGPRATQLSQLASCLLATLGLEVVDVPARAVDVGGDVRVAVAAAIASEIAPALVPAQLRTDILAMARERCEPSHLEAFDKLVPQLDDRLAIPRRVKVPLDVVQSVQHALTEARATVFGRAANAAIDRAKDVLATANPDAAMRIDQPVTLRLTPRDIAVRRACDPRLTAIPDVVAQTLLDALTDVAEIAWGAPVIVARPYRVSETFAVGDHIEHPKFGRGVVRAVSAQRVDVEFADGAHTLVHARS